MRITIGRRSLFGLLCVGALACTDRSDGEGLDTDSGSSAGTGTSGTSGMLDTSSTSGRPTSSTSGADTITATDDGVDDSTICVLHHHEVGSLEDCRADADCCKDEKCVPVPYGSRECVPLDSAAVGIGEACTRRGIWDDCVAGSVCRGVDPETGDGRCVEICGGGHVCDDPALTCVEEPQQLCLLPCDPLVPSCPGGDLCLPMLAVELFACLPDDWSTRAGGYGDSCFHDPEIHGGCDPGALCVHDTNVDIESCANDFEEGCCTVYCDLADPRACAGTSGVCEPMHSEIIEFWAEETYGVGFCR